MGVQFPNALLLLFPLRGFPEGEADRAMVLPFGGVQGGEVELTGRRVVWYRRDVPIIRKIFRHSQGMVLCVPREVGAALGVTMGDYVAWRIGADGLVQLVSLEEEFNASRQRRAGASGLLVAPGESKASIRR